MTLTELCRKDVIQVITGANLGRVDDLEFAEDTAAVQALVLFGRPKLFGLLGRGENVRIPWEDITSVGMDVILVKTEVPKAPPIEGKSILSKWFT